MLSNLVHFVIRLDQNIFTAHLGESEHQPEAHCARCPRKRGSTSQCTCPTCYLFAAHGNESREEADPREVGHTAVSRQTWICFAALPSV